MYCLSLLPRASDRHHNRASAAIFGSGLAAARARGRTGGQKPKLGYRQVALARLMYDETSDDGKRRYTVAQIAAEFGVTRPTIYRHLEFTAASGHEVRAADRLRSTHSPPAAVTSRVRPGNSSSSRASRPCANRPWTCLPCGTPSAARRPEAGHVEWDVVVAEHGPRLLVGTRHEHALHAHRTSRLRDGWAEGNRIHDVDREASPLLAHVKDTFSAAEDN